MDKVYQRLKPTLLWLTLAFQRWVKYQSERVTVNNEMGAFAMRAYPARIPFGGINVKNGFGKQVNINTNSDLMVDTAVIKIQEALQGLDYLPAKDDTISALLCRRKHRYTDLAVHDDDIIHVLECLHEYHELQLNFDELKKEWAIEFQRTLNRLHEKKGVLSVKGAALGLLAEILTQYGGFNNDFTRKNARAQLKSRAGMRDTINQDQFCKAMVFAVSKVTDSNRISIPNPGHIASLLQEWGPGRLR